MNCPKCNAPVAEGVKFCPECGNKLVKECPQCHKQLALSVKFCDDCGYNFNAMESNAGGKLMGDKNVVAGDVINGNQDSRKYYGNVSNNTTTTTNTVNTTNTTVINQDETKKVVTCHICGRNVTFDQVINCPGCHQPTCENCYDFSTKLCKQCVADQKSKKDEVYKQTLFHVLEDGIISAQERGELLQLQKQLGLSDSHAEELEKLCKAERSAGVSNTAKPLSMFEKISLDKARTLLWDSGKGQEAWTLIDSVYQQHKFDEDVISLRIQCAQKTLPSNQFGTFLQEIHADIPAAYLAAIDFALQENDLNAAENSLKTAERFWPGNYLITCRKALYTLAIADALNEDAFIQQALGLIMDASEPTEKLERSWKAKVMNSIAIASGDEPEKFTPEICRTQDLYYGIVSTSFIGKNRLAISAEAERKQKLSEDYIIPALKLLEGNGVIQNETKAIKLLKEAAELGNPYAQYRLGECYLYGKGAETNDAEAVKWYRKAADQGNADAQYRLAICYGKGYGVEENYDEATEWYQKAAERGNAEAQVEIGNRMGNDPQAVKWYQKAAEQGNAEGMGHLCYCLGKIDNKKAMEWCQKAIDLGDRTAMMWLGDCYRKGDGVVKDREKAIEWYRKAKAHGVYYCPALDDLELEIEQEKEAKLAKQKAEEEAALAKQKAEEEAALAKQKAEDEACRKKGIYIVRKQDIVYLKEVDVNMISFEVPSIVTAICAEAFYGRDSIKEIVIPEGVTMVGHKAFAYMDDLELVTFPSSLQWIGTRDENGSAVKLFVGCNKLKKIRVPENSLISKADWQKMLPERLIFNKVKIEYY